MSSQITITLGQTGSLYARYNAGRVIGGKLNKARMGDPIAKLGPSLSKGYDLVKGTAMLVCPFASFDPHGQQLVRESMLQYAMDLEAEGIREISDPDKGGGTWTFNSYAARMAFLRNFGFEGPMGGEIKGLNDPEYVVVLGNRRWYAGWPASLPWSENHGKAPAEYPLPCIVRDFPGWEELADLQVDENAQEGKEPYDEVGLLAITIPWVKHLWGAGVVSRKLNLPYGKAQKYVGLARLAIAYPRLNLLERFAMPRITHKDADNKQRVLYERGGYLDITPLQWQHAYTLLGEMKKPKKGQKPEPQDDADVREALPDFTPGNRATEDEVEEFLRYKMSGRKASASLGKSAMEVLQGQVKGTGGTVEKMVDAYLAGDRVAMAALVEEETSPTAKRVLDLYGRLSPADQYTVWSAITSMDEPVVPAEEAKAEEAKAEEAKAEEAKVEEPKDGHKSRKAKPKAKS